MPTLTIFTPAYNRAHTIGRTYESLCRQTSMDFEWLVVDDGSTDNTADLVRSWIDSAPFKIRYIHQENQGMHGAHNTAYRNITTELNTCIDSDDWMPDDAVEAIVSFWREHGSDRYAGIIGLDVDDKGILIGSEFNNDLKTTTVNGFYRNGGSGDKKMVYRTDIINKYPEYPRFKGERYFSLGYKYFLIDQDYELLTLNRPLVVVDYQLDGSSHSMYKQYWNNPEGFRYLRLFNMKYAQTFKERFKTCIHYVSSSLRCKSKRIIRESYLPITTLLAYPFGVALYLYTRHNVKHNGKMKIK